MKRDGVVFALALVATLQLGVSARSLRGQRQNPIPNGGVNDAKRFVTMELRNWNNVQYTGPISIGGQILPVIYDTGSFEVIVLSTLCQHCTKELTAYDSTMSKSFVGASDHTMQHFFGSGSVRSQRGYDTVRIGDNLNNLAVAHAPFWQVVSHEIAVWDNAAHFSGIVGLGRHDYVPQGFGDDNFGQKILLASLGVTRFAICLERSSPAAPGVLTLWTPPPNSFAPPLGFSAVQVLGKAHWSVRMTGVKLSNLQVDDPCIPSCGAIIDSGTSLIAVPPSASGLIDALIDLFRPDCSNLHDMPTLELQLDGVPVRLPPHAYVVQQTLPFYNSSFGSERLLQCSLGFMNVHKTSDLGSVWILGMPFLRYYYTIFDRSGSHLYIAPSTPTCAWPSSVAFARSPQNSSHLSTQRAASVHTSTMAAMTYSPSDYEPIQVDVAGLRMPPWAVDGTGVNHKMLL
eukprot:TRINITY_DN55029_c0_g1_i1.p1 TRINITY_DN55029_c0_g1~~TRINITY_DN55029_c0_g1_i1.p1  ORF type:complete len:457 (-),score=54.84 TRINITY_DN55029_c0_g1_i1:125-1495(-)